MNTDPNQKPASQEDTKPSPDRGNEGLGAALRRERERQGISIEGLSEIIRVRSHVLDAIEEERWDRLPAPVFVKGFIRSYTTALGMDTAKALALYAESGTGAVEPPKPLQKPVRNRGKTVGVGIALMIFVFSALYLWNTDRPPSTPPKPARSDPAGPVAEVEEPAPKASQNLPEGSQGARAGSAEKADEPRPAAVPREEEEVRDAPAPTIPEGSRSETTSTIGEALQVTDRPPAERPDEAYEKPAAPELREGEIQGGEEKVTLRMDVREPTWVRILIDEGDPKEYIFKPGSRPEWKGERGFEVLIGNAGGVDIEFNGERIRNLGRSGKVVSLRLPEDYEKRGVKNDSEKRL